MENGRSQAACLEFNRPGGHYSLKMIRLRVLADAMVSARMSLARNTVAETLPAQFRQSRNRN